ncbi:hypothetical protein AAMO2058_001045400 [Amorphochlora amoebiformis]
MKLRRREYGLSYSNEFRENLISVLFLHTRKGDGAGARGRAVISFLRDKKSEHQAIKDCPGLVVLPMDTDYYRFVSRQILQVLTKSTETWRAKIEKSSYDDYYIDVTGRVTKELAKKEGEISKFLSAYPPEEDAPKIAHLIPRSGDLKTKIKLQVSEIEGEIGRWWACGVRMALHLQKKIMSKTDGLSISIGIGPNKLVARLVSGLHKPAGVTVVDSGDRVRNLMDQTRIQSIPGLMGQLGRRVLDILKLHDEAKASDLYSDRVLKLLTKELGDEKARYVIHKVRAEDDSPVVPRGPPKSVISERSFPPTSKLNILKGMSKMLAVRLLRRLEEDATESNRCPNRLFIKWRVGYSQRHSLVSRTVTRPSTLAPYLQTKTGERVIPSEAASFRAACRGYSLKGTLNETALGLVADIVDICMQILKKCQGQELTRLILGAEDFVNLPRNTVKSYFSKRPLETQRDRPAASHPDGRKGKRSRSERGLTLSHGFAISSKSTSEANGGDRSAAVTKEVINEFFDI